MHVGRIVDELPDLFDLRFRAQAKERARMFGFGQRRDVLLLLGCFLGGLYFDFPGRPVDKINTGFDMQNDAPGQFAFGKLEFDRTVRTFAHASKKCVPVSLRGIRADRKFQEI